MKSLTDTFKTNNGIEIPCIGFGTWQTPEGQVAVDATKCAIEAGYRHIDTADIYQNEESVGTACLTLEDPVCIRTKLISNYTLI